MAFAAALMAGVGCGIIGMLACSKLKKRQQMLGAWVRFITRLKTTLNTQRLPIDQVLESGLPENPVLDDQIKKTCAIMRQNPAVSAQEAFSKASPQGFEAKDLALIDQFLLGLGTGTLEKRQAATDLSLQQMAAAFEHARELYEKNGRLYQNLGWLGGLALVLLLV